MVLIGRLIGTLDTQLNQERWTQTQRRIAGVAAIILLVIAAAIVARSIDQLLRLLPAGPLWIALAASILIAQRSLYQHVDRVAAAFDRGGLAEARRAVAMIVGRETAQLDESAVCRAAIESCAENFSDGVVAPVFWLALFGLPGLAIYKAVNTADSMIGHRSKRHEAFGWAAARLDDLLNLIPARLSGVLLALVAPVARRRHRSLDAHDGARRAASSLAQRGLAGKRDGRRARPCAGRTAALRLPCRR